MKFVFEFWRKRKLLNFGVRSLEEPGWSNPVESDKRTTWPPCLCIYSYINIQMDSLSSAPTHSEPMELLVFWHTETCLLLAVKDCSSARKHACLLLGDMPVCCWQWKIVLVHRNMPVCCWQWKIVLVHRNMPVCCWQWKIVLVHRNMPVCCWQWKIVLLHGNMPVAGSERSQLF